MIPAPAVLVRSIRNAMAGQDNLGLVLIVFTVVVFNLDVSEYP